MARPKWRYFFCYCDTIHVIHLSYILPVLREIDCLRDDTLMQSFVPVSKEEIAARFPEISITTVERVLGKLVREGKIEKIGTFRDARYRKL